MKFITIANEYPSKMMLLENFEAAEAPGVQVLLLIAAATAAAAAAESQCVVQPLDCYNKLYDFKNTKAVAVVPLSSTLIPLNEAVGPQKFLQMGRGEGAAATIQIPK